MKIFTIDIGNTKTKAVLYINGTPSAKVTTETTEDILKLYIECKPDKTGISSVNPKRHAELLQNFPAHVSTEFININSNLNFNFKNDYETPESLGADRICCCAGAMHLSGNSQGLVVAIDSGTCITTDIINQGKFLGGLISPGVDMMLKAMHNYTGKLPLLEKYIPANSIGRNTNDCMMSGVAAYLASFSTYIEKLEKKFNSSGTIYVTGGAGMFIQSMLPEGTIFEENLVNEGIRVLTELNGN